ncbi:uncharacterized protein VTP21DRAFT_9136 [Calcarisporiella thermophila]|uniref:uncharacterized protein n=1 Tax=Calcarisporiella thermophila TaxID=911321 RepID=UPI0037435042
MLISTLFLAIGIAYMSVMVIFRDEIALYYNIMNWAFYTLIGVGAVIALSGVLGILGSYLRHYPLVLAQSIAAWVFTFSTTLIMFGILAVFIVNRNVIIENCAYDVTQNMSAGSSGSTKDGEWVIREAVAACSGLVRTVSIAWTVVSGVLFIIMTYFSAVISSYATILSVKQNPHYKMRQSHDWEEKAQGLAQPY